MMEIPVMMAVGHKDATEDMQGKISAMSVLTQDEKREREREKTTNLDV